MPFAFACPHCGAGYRIKEELAGKRSKCQKCGQTMVLHPPLAETTAGGSEVFRHQARERDLEFAHGDSDLVEAVSSHIEHYLGEGGHVFHELVSDLVHIDVHISPPQRERKWITLVTSGMSERPMHVPDEVQEFEYLELAACLPPGWPLDQENLQDPNNHWPIRGLKMLARLPHEYETWLGPGHTIPNGDPPDPFADGTKLCCFLVTPPLGLPAGFEELRVPDGRKVNFCSIVPLYREEMNLKLSKGTDALIERLQEIPVEELYQPARKNVAKKRFGLF